MRRFLLAGSGAVLATGLVFPAFAGGNGDHTNHTSGNDNRPGVCASGQNPDAGNTLALKGDAELWPPNHKYAPYEVVATEGDSDTTDGVKLTTWITHDEFVTEFVPEDANDQPAEDQEYNGAGNTQNDATPYWDQENDTSTTDGDAFVANTEHKIRAERSGRGNGREYTINAEAIYDNGGDTDDKCTASWTVFVPHDMGQGGDHKPDQTAGE